ncbi:MAG: hypothetical protein P8P74_03530 [Crocinitomicaceae bacterium]|nr:hypothetical protein [Crocinitomicaceae bacterium]
MISKDIFVPYYPLKIGVIKFLTVFLLLLSTQIVVSQSESILEVKKVFFDKKQHDTIRADAAIKLADNIYATDLDLHLF